MIVADTLRSARFYADALGFEVAAQGPPVDRSDAQPAWLLLRRGATEMMLHARAAWPANVALLHPGAPLTLVLPGAARASLVDPDGARVEVLPREPVAVRRAA